MSNEINKLQYSVAKRLATEIVNQLEPYCERIEIAGSVRRQRPLVGDIEIVCIRKEVQDDFFGDSRVPHPGFAGTLNRWEAVKGKPDGRYTQRLVPLFDPNGVKLREVKLDVFMANPDNWGLILAMRTGSAAYSREVLAQGWTAKGYTSREGILYDKYTQKPTFIREEAELFELLGIPFPDPKSREC